MWYYNVRPINKGTGDDITFTYAPDGNRISKLTDTRNTYYVRDASGNIMATYTLIDDCLTLDEHPLYGSSRLGVRQKEICMDDVPTADPDFMGIVYVERGWKKYELSNHLGNVLTVITDRRSCYGTYDEDLYYEPDIVTITDYYPFGSPMGVRTEYQEGYRFGFNGQERDDDFNGNYAFKFRIHDSRLGRFFSIDPLFKDYPWNSVYAFAENNVIQYVELEGLEQGTKTGVWGKDGYYKEGTASQNSGLLKQQLQEVLFNTKPAVNTLGEAVFPIAKDDNKVTIGAKIPIKPLAKTSLKKVEAEITLKKDELPIPFSSNEPCASCIGLQTPYGKITGVDYLSPKKVGGGIFGFGAERNSEVAVVQLSTNIYDPLNKTIIPVYNTLYVEKNIENMSAGAGVSGSIESRDIFISTPGGQRILDSKHFRIGGSIGLGKIPFLGKFMSINLNTPYIDVTERAKRIK